jgi:hypothetical protein
VNRVLRSASLLLATAVGAVVVINAGMATGCGPEHAARRDRPVPGPGPTSAPAAPGTAAPTPSANTATTPTAAPADGPGQRCPLPDGTNRAADTVGICAPSKPQPEPTKVPPSYWLPATKAAPVLRDMAGPQRR